MGANIKVEGNSATIEGVEKFTAARVSAPDLRAGAALCIAGLATEGITIVDDIVYIQRGYERFEEKLRIWVESSRKCPVKKEIQKFKLKVGLNRLLFTTSCGRQRADTDRIRRNMM